MSFFRQFPTTQYDILRDGSLTTIVDLFRNVTAKSKIKLDPNLAYTYYDVQNGDRPDVVSQKLYGDSDYYWTFFIINDFLKRGLNEWPKSQKEMEDYLTHEYDQYSVIQMSDTSSGYDSSGTYLTNVNGIDFLNNQYYVTDSYGLNSARVMKYDPSMQQLWIYNSASSSTLVSNYSTFNLTCPANTKLNAGPFISATSFPGSGGMIASVTPSLISSGRNAVHHFAFYVQPGSTVINFNGITGQVTDVLPNSAFPNSRNGVVVTDSYGNQIAIYFTDLHGVNVAAQDVSRGIYSSNQVIAVTYADWENDLNDIRSRIRVVNPSYIRAFVQQYREVLNA